MSLKVATEWAKTGKAICVPNLQVLSVGGWWSGDFDRWK
jgi:hypothetical protein